MGGHATTTTRMVLTNVKTVASFVPPNPSTFQVTARYAARRTCTWVVKHAVEWVAIPLHEVVARNVHLGEMSSTVAHPSDPALVAASSVDELVQTESDNALIEYTPLFSS